MLRFWCVPEPEVHVSDERQLTCKLRVRTRPTPTVVFRPCDYGECWMAAVWGGWQPGRARRLSGRRFEAPEPGVCRSEGSPCSAQQDRSRRFVWTHAARPG